MAGQPSWLTLPLPPEVCRPLPSLHSTPSGALAQTSSVELCASTGPTRDAPPMSSTASSASNARAGGPRKIVGAGDRVMVATDRAPTPTGTADPIRGEVVV